MPTTSQASPHRSETDTPEPIALTARAIRASWSAATAASDNWNPAHSSVGQSAVTALVLQDLFGGQLLQATVQGVSHYWNRLPNGTEVDLTRDQFDRFIVDSPPKVRDRTYVLSFPSTLLRYDRLRSAVDATLRELQVSCSFLSSHTPVVAYTCGQS